MNTPPTPQAILCIDLKKNRIRIHRQTLHLLGDPDYIQLLVNPSKMMAKYSISIKNTDLKIVLVLFHGNAELRLPFVRV